jgi:hypothetical protein
VSQGHVQFEFGFPRACIRRESSAPRAMAAARAQAAVAENAYLFETVSLWTKEWQCVS